MTRPILIFRVGWMESYSGKAPIFRGGSSVDELGEGGEMWNFRVEEGKCYGWVYSLNYAGVNLKRIFPDDEWNDGDECEGIDVVYISSSKDLGQVVIGWHRDATVFHKAYSARSGTSYFDNDLIDYISVVEAENAVLLPEDARVFQVPHGKGFPGMSHVWYEHNEGKDVRKFLRKLRRLMDSEGPTPRSAMKRPKKRGKVGRWPVPSNRALMAEIEEAAVEEAWAYYESKGYDVQSVESECLGWDLEVSRGKETMLIEVKGHMGDEIQFEMTPNEYAQMKANVRNYKLCVVLRALETEPELIELVPEFQEDEDYWVLFMGSATDMMYLHEKTAAKAESN